MIKIIRGTFGYNDGKGIVPKTIQDEPFSCDEKLEKRLVAEGVAVYVGETEAKAEAEVEAEVEVKAETEAPKELDKEALVARYKELGLGGNPSSWKAETIARKIAEAEAEAKCDAEEDEAPVFDEVDGVV